MKKPNAPQWVWLAVIIAGFSIRHVAEASGPGVALELGAGGESLPGSSWGLDGPNLMPVRVSRASASLWSIDLGAAILTRGTLAGSTIMEEVFPASGSLLLGSDFRFDYAAGPDISGVRVVEDGGFIDSVDFRYFDAQSISGEREIDTQGKVWRFPDGQTSTISNTNEVHAQYTSQLYSFETNIRREVSDSPVVVLAGFRWIQMNDSMGLVGVAANTISWNYNTNNNLYGCQIGAIMPLISSQSPWSLSVSPKVGIYGNQCLSRWDDGVPAGTIDNKNSIFRNQVAFVGDLSLRLGFRVSKRCALLAGYQLLWLNGVGVAADQATVLSARSIATGLNSSGSGFFRGALAGIHFSW